MVVGPSVGHTIPGFALYNSVDHAFQSLAFIDIHPRKSTLSSLFMVTLFVVLRVYHVVNYLQYVPIDMILTQSLEAERLTSARSLGSS